MANIYDNIFVINIYINKTRKRHVSLMNNYCYFSQIKPKSKLIVNQYKKYLDSRNPEIVVSCIKNDIQIKPILRLMNSDDIDCLISSTKKSLNDYYAKLFNIKDECINSIHTGNLKYIKLTNIINIQMFFHDSRIHNRLNVLKYLCKKYRHKCDDYHDHLIRIRSFKIFKYLFVKNYAKIINSNTSNMSVSMNRFVFSNYKTLAYSVNKFGEDIFNTNVPCRFETIRNNHIKLLKLIPKKYITRIYPNILIDVFELNDINIIKYLHKDCDFDFKNVKHRILPKICKLNKLFAIKYLHEEHNFTKNDFQIVSIIITRMVTKNINNNLTDYIINTIGLQIDINMYKKNYIKPYKY